MRKYLRRSLAGLMTVALLGGSTACTKDSPEPRTHQVSTDGGSYDFGDMAITVPRGAIDKNAKLAVTVPEQRKAAESPFGAATNKAFDVSFQGGLQPADGKPLELRIPLRGNMLPQGYTPNQALFYHRLPNNQGFRWVPTVLDGDVMVAPLPHLSEWQLVYLSNNELRAALGMGELVDREDCNSQAEGKSSGKVRISKRTGWGENSGPIRACLYVQRDGEAYLSVANHASYMLSVAATSGLSIQVTSGGVTEDMVRMLAAFGAGKNVKGFLGREGELTAKLTADNLPATVQFRAEPNTFLAEAFLFGLSLVSSVVLGKSVSETANQVKALIEAPGVIDCLRTQMSAATGKKPSFWDVFDMLISKCGETIIMALDGSKAWQSFWEYHLILAELVKEGWSAFWSFVHGIEMTFRGTVGVTVSRVAPECLSKSEFHDIMQAHFSDKRVRILNDNVLCQQSWAYNRTTYFLEEYNIYGDGMHTFLRWNGKQWAVYRAGGSGSYFIGLDSICDELPSRIKAKVCVKPGG